MSKTFHKILRKPFNGGTITAIFSHQNPTPSLVPHLVRQLKPKTKNPSPGSSSGNKSTHFSRLHVYPGFSFGYFLNPISSTGFPDSKPQEDLELDWSGSSTRMIWADSVKKKRKRKMNKHKLKKLKKRLRH